ncbi:MAG: hypothetical protein HOV79_08205 [Hamadaea sp.]|nr:hypothetical protein [Hamadaea sp.]
MTAVTALLERIMTAWSRITPAVLLVRLVTFVLTAVALTMAIPSFLFSVKFLGVAFLGALLVALAPGSRIVTLTLLGAYALWGAAWMGRIGEISPVELVAFGSLAYLAHSSATLAALIPYDAVVSPEVLSRWYLRALGVVAASAVISLTLIVGVWAVGETDGTAIASLVGLAAAVALVVVGVRLARRRSA